MVINTLQVSVKVLTGDRVTDSTKMISLVYNSHMLLQITSLDEFITLILLSNMSD